MENIIINTPKIIENITNKSWDQWLNLVEIQLLKLGYRKYKQNYKKEDFAYWKPFEVDGIETYQIGLLFYDFRQYTYTNPSANRISISFECNLLDINSRINLSVSDDITLQQFEIMSLDFYKTMSKYK